MSVLGAFFFRKGTGAGEKGDGDGDGIVTLCPSGALRRQSRLRTGALWLPRT